LDLHIQFNPSKKKKNEIEKMRLRLNHLFNIAIAICPLTTTAFSSHSYTNIKTASSSSSPFGGRQTTKLHVGSDLHEFDYLLQEGGNTVDFSSSTRQTRRVAIVNDGVSQQKCILASSTSSSVLEDFVTDIDKSELSESVQGEKKAFTEFDPFAEKNSAQYQSKLSESSDMTPWIEKDFTVQDAVLTYIIPVFLLGWGGKVAFVKLSAIFAEKMSSTLDAFVEEMLYHSGNFDEMKLCYEAYSRKLIILGPKKGDIMIKGFLEKYSKKATVSPQTISSLSYVFSLFKLSEAKTAKVLVELCADIGVERSSATGKILFLGSRILKTDEAIAALMPIKELIMTTYRDEEVAETLVDTSQIAMAEAAYRVCIQKAYTKKGAKLKKLPGGWEVLGLAKFEAQAVFDEEEKKDFVTDREEMYGGQKLNYDKDGNLITKKGKKVDPEDAVEDDDEELEATSNVFECQKCSYTIFIAEGRESKFYGAGFTCPECGAGKDEFKAPIDDDESDDEE